MGLPGTGQRHTAARLDYLLPDYERVLGKKFMKEEGFDPQDFPFEDSTKAYKKLLSDLLLPHLMAQRSVIIDNAGFTKDMRQWHYAMAKFNKTRPLVIVHHANPDITAQDAATADDPSRYDRYRMIYEQPLDDLSLTRNSHVSMIIYDTEKRRIHPARVLPDVEEFVAEVRAILIGDN